MKKKLINRPRRVMLTPIRSMEYSPLSEIMKEYMEPGGRYYPKNLEGFMIIDIALAVLLGIFFMIVYSELRSNPKEAIRLYIFGIPLAIYLFKLVIYFIYTKFLNPYKHSLVLLINAAISQWTLFIGLGAMVWGLTDRYVGKVNISLLFMPLSIIWFSIWTCIYLAYLRRQGIKSKLPRRLYNNYPSMIKTFFIPQGIGGVILWISTAGVNFWVNGLYGTYFENSLGLFCLYGFLIILSCIQAVAAPEPLIIIYGYIKYFKVNSKETSIDDHSKNAI